ncbi:MAG: transglycosylase SLT domain-containing protein [Myxococcota bacterium]|nr:transglycosylase SLT domain-containing protein [Myxococcota bacterium]
MHAVLALLMLTTSAVADPTVKNLATAWHRLHSTEGSDDIRPMLVDASEPWVGHAAAITGIASWRMGDLPSAVQSLQDALADPKLKGPLRRQTRYHLALSLMGVEDPDGAVAQLTPLLAGRAGRPGVHPPPGDVDAASIRWALSNAHAQLGQPAAQRTTLETIWTHHPTSQQSTDALQTLVQLGHPIDAQSAEGVALIEHRIQTLERQFMHTEAVALRQQLPASHRLRRPAAFAEAVFKSKDYAKASSLLAALPARTPDQQILLALAYVRSGQPNESVRVYSEVAASGNSASELASYKLGYMAFDRGQWSQAIALFKTHLGRYGNGRHADAARWFTGLSRLRLGEMGAAHRSFQQLEVLHPSSSLRAGAVYWQAHTTRDDGARTQLLDRILRTWPESSYAWHASHLLEVNYPAKPAATDAPNADGAPPVGDPTAWEMGRALTKVGLLSWARAHLLDIPTRGLKRSDVIRLANAHVEAGSYRTAQAMVRPWCGNPADATERPVIEACWPRPSADDLHADVQASGLPDYLPYAIMTAESALDPAVTSPAGARGLMQLMPFLADELHRAMFPTQAFNPDQLYDPVYNARLGTSELIRLAEQFAEVGVDDPLPMVIAGYNGGPDAVGRWVDEYTATMESNHLTDWSKRPEADLWAEYIGYGETRKYVRRVLGFLQRYRLAYGEPVQVRQAP